MQAPADDIDRAHLTIQRAVTHPDRNQPEIKDTKTTSSHRIIALSAPALSDLSEGEPGQFLIGGPNPFCYIQVRHMCDRIRKGMGFDTKIIPARFRTTVLTDLYGQTKDIKLAQAAAGHTTSAMTLKHYVKGRESSVQTTAAVEWAYTAQVAQSAAKSLFFSNELKHLKTLFAFSIPTP